MTKMGQKLIKIALKCVCFLRIFRICSLKFFAGGRLGGGHYLNRTQCPWPGPEIKHQYPTRDIKTLFLPRDALCIVQSAVLRSHVVYLSVCLSVCPSVRL